MTEERLALGRRGEAAAQSYLRRRGWKILQSNYRTPVGEIDIIARRLRQLIFVEVKTRRSTRFGLPQEAVGTTKQRQISRTAHWYLNEHDLGRLQPRFDVIAVLQGEHGLQIEHFPAAFDAAE